ncbi:MAG: low molecular weight protein-tyrosine-phosphatase [Anaerolineae bacterium]
MISVVFVCLGNICRSPMAEAVFKDLVEKEGLADQFRIDSAGTSRYHIGEPAHRGTRRVLADHGIRSDSIARQVSASDLAHADYLVAMDHSNVTEMRYMARGAELDGRLLLLLDFAENTRLQDVPDPYYTGNFEEVFRLVESGCRGLLAHIRAEKGI